MIVIVRIVCACIACIHNYVCIIIQFSYDTSDVLYNFLHVTRPVNTHCAVLKSTTYLVADLAEWVTALSCKIRVT